MSNDKRIHGIWLGPNKIPEFHLRCIDSWQRYNPDYTIKIWTDQDIDFKSKFMDRALKDKSYAFASDYYRLMLIYRHGGIYLDTDVEVIRPLDCLLENKLFFGYEDNVLINAAVMGGQPENRMVAELLNAYDSMIGYETIPRILTKFLNSKDSVELLDVKVYPSCTFYPFNPQMGKGQYKLMYSDITPETVAIHHYAHGWRFSLMSRIINKFRRILE